MPRILREALRAHVPGSWIYIDEVDFGPAILGAGGGGNEGVGAGPDQITGADLDCHAGNVQGAGGSVYSHTVGGAGVFNDDALEHRDFRTLGDEIGLQDLDDGVDVVLVDVLAAVGNHRINLATSLLFQLDVDIDSVIFAKGLLLPWIIFLGVSSSAWNIARKKVLL